MTTHNAQAMRDEAKLDHTVVGWEPGWSFNGPRAHADQDDGDATLAVHEVDFGDTVASIEIAHVFPDILGRGYTSTVGIELTLGNVRDLIERLSEICAAALLEIDDVRFAIDYYIDEANYLATLPDYDEADVEAMRARQERLIALAKKVDPDPCYGIHNFVRTTSDPLGPARCTECQALRLD